MGLFNKIVGDTGEDIVVRALFRMVPSVQYYCAETH